MSTTAKDTPDAGLGLSRSESWVLHHVLVDRIDTAIEAGERPPWWALQVATKLEAQGAVGPTASDHHSGTGSLSCFEAWRVRRALLEYAESDSTPGRDATAAKAIVRSIDTTFEAPPPAVRS